jgi:serine/threonine protein phosphatase PrpC
MLKKLVSLNQWPLWFSYLNRHLSFLGLESDAAHAFIKFDAKSKQIPFYIFCKNQGCYYARIGLSSIRSSTSKENTGLPFTKHIKIDIPLQKLLTDLSFASHPLSSISLPSEEQLEYFFYQVIKKRVSSYQAAITKQGFQLSMSDFNEACVVILSLKAKVDQPAKPMLLLPPEQHPLFALASKPVPGISELGLRPSMPGSTLQPKKFSLPHFSGLWGTDCGVRPPSEDLCALHQPSGTFIVCDGAGSEHAFLAPHLFARICFDSLTKLSKNEFFSLDNALQASVQLGRALLNIFPDQRLSAPCCRHLPQTSFITAQVFKQDQQKIARFIFSSGDCLGLVLDKQGKLLFSTESFARPGNSFMQITERFLAKKTLLHKSAPISQDDFHTALHQYFAFGRYTIDLIGTSTKLKDIKLVGQEVPVTKGCVIILCTNGIHHNLSSFELQNLYQYLCINKKQSLKKFYQFIAQIVYARQQEPDPYCFCKHTPYLQADYVPPPQIPLEVQPHIVSQGILRQYDQPSRKDHCVLVVGKI